MNEKETIMAGLRQIAGGVPTHTAAAIAKELLGRMETALSPIMASPKMLDYAIELPTPWEPVPVTATGERMYRHPDGRLACGIATEAYNEIFFTPFAPAAHSVVRGGGFIYIEASDEEALIRNVRQFDENYRAAIAAKIAPPAVRRLRRGRVVRRG